MQIYEADQYIWCDTGNRLMVSEPECSDRTIEEFDMELGEVGSIRFRHLATIRGRRIYQAVSLNPRPCPMRTQSSGTITALNPPPAESE